jgi:hypothetical protein
MLKTISFDFFYKIEEIYIKNIITTCTFTNKKKNSFKPIITLYKQKK